MLMTILKTTFLAILFFVASTIVAQNEGLPTNLFQQEFNAAYQQYPNIPKGVLEAVSFTTTRFQHLKNTQESCVGLPKTYGVMGLTLDGKGYFRNNLNYIAQVSGISITEILDHPQQNIMAFAKAYVYEQSLLSPFPTQSQNISKVLANLSELPNNNLSQDYALNAHLYAVLSFMNNEKNQAFYQFPSYQLNLKAVFGEANLKVLSSNYIKISENEIKGDGGITYKGNPNNKSLDYPAAILDLTTCNFSSRSGTAISAVAIHTMQGSYAGSISWFKNCSANASAHYMLRSSDGQVTQMVLESDKGWHIGSENPYTIGLEHEGFINDSTWYTAAMYQSSANLVVDITQSGYGINPLRTAYFPWVRTTSYNVSSIPGSCIKIKGHHHFPNQTHTDPGANWDWDYYFKLINDPTSNTTVNTNATGNAYDLGGATGNYTNDERTLFLIQPTNATSISLTVNQFDVEATWDYLYIYEGTTVFDPKIGEYTGTTIPSSINVNSGAVLIEFRSDCATAKAGYDIAWSSLITGVSQQKEAIFSVYPNPSTNKITINFKKPEKGILTITDLSGRVMQQVTLQSVATKLVDVSAFANGIYLIQFNKTVVKLFKH